MQRIYAKRPRPSAATGIAFLALVLAAGGADAIAGAASRLIDGKRIKAATITSKQVRDNTLRVADLSRTARAQLRGATGPAGAPGKDGSPGPQGPSGIVGEAGGDVTGPFGNLQIAPNAVTGAEVDESTLTDGEVVFVEYDAAGSQLLADFGFGTLVGECTASSGLRGFMLTVTGPAMSFSQVVLAGRASAETPFGGGPANVSGPLSQSIAFAPSASANRPWTATISVRDAQSNGGRQVEILANGFTKDGGGNGCRTWLRVLR